MSDIKSEQLGMSYGTAGHRLVKDILFDFIVKTDQNTCYQCGKSMTRETFSIEHKIPWLHSENPTDLFFDLANISYSHKSCNYSAARKQKPYQFEHGKVATYRRGCRCELCASANRDRVYRTRANRPNKR